MTCELIEYPDIDHEYPVGKLDDVIIYFVHYASFHEAKEKWEERKKRINYNNLFFIFTERDGCNYEMIKEFENLPYKNKVVFTIKKYPEITSSICLPHTVINSEVRDLCSYKNLFTKQRWIDTFDYVAFLNTGEIK